MPRALSARSLLSLLSLASVAACDGSPTSTPDAGIDGELPALPVRDGRVLVVGGWSGFDVGVADAGTGLMIRERFVDGSMVGGRSSLGGAGVLLGDHAWVVVSFSDGGELDGLVVPGPVPPAQWIYDHRLVRLGL